MRHKYYQVGSIVGLVLVLDLITKYIIMTQVTLHDTITIIPGFFNITHVRNKGAAFGLFSTLPDHWRSAFFIVVTIIALSVLIALIVKTHERLPVYSFSLIAGGALGNLVDRVRFGEVVDFVQWYIKSYYWPSFNVADSAITIGIVLLAIEMLFMKRVESQVSIPKE